MGDLMKYEAVIGLEVHAELQTRSKMFCSCPVADNTSAAPNSAVCPVCAGMPGMLPVLNQRAVELGMRVALALGCEVAHTSLFDRKNYFYPDLPKGYQISQYEFPLAQHGVIEVTTPAGEKTIRVRRVHLEEDTGKLTHVEKDGESFSLVDLNRAGVPLLEIVSEPDMHTLDEVRAYAGELRAILRAVKAGSGDMEKGALRLEANVSIRPEGTSELGTRVEIKNLNSFRSMERAIIYQLYQQARILDQGGKVDQETLGWDETNGVTFSQRSKEDAHDYRYFPEPDLPPLVIDVEWVKRVSAALPELPRARELRFRNNYSLGDIEAHLMGIDEETAAYFEDCVRYSNGIPAKTVAKWISGELFGWMNQKGTGISGVNVSPANLAELLQLVSEGEINLTTAKTVFTEMLDTGGSAGKIISSQGLQQISDNQLITGLVENVLKEFPAEVESYLGGKETLAKWFFGQVMRSAKGKANPQVLQEELDRQLAGLRNRT
jgi:aspartyl-tRNA(Asn)/glutamyl-tRNA(Gln) amidotransferase subunit B